MTDPIGFSDAEVKLMNSKLHQLVRFIILNVMILKAATHSKRA
jgi:hypothetical protein